MYVGEPVTDLVYGVAAYDRIYNGSDTLCYLNYCNEFGMVNQMKFVAYSTYSETDFLHPNIFDVRRLEQVSF